MPSPDAAHLLASSSDRQRLLAHLVDHPGSPADLAETLSLSRRSVQRHLRQFADRGWAEKADGAYRLTVPGELVAAEHATYVDALDTVERFSPLFAHLPDREHAPDPRLLDDATLVAADAASPQAPVRHYLESVRTFETDRIRMVSAVLSRLFHEVHADLALDGVHTELVMAADTIDRARELNPAEFEIVVSVDVLDLYRHPDEIPVGLTLGDDRVLIGAYDDDGNLRACVDSANPDLVAWGERLFERYRAQSKRIEPSFSLPFSLRR
jgi:predicted transcriptional regulator